MGPAIEPGEVIGGKYRIERVLGRGGMGIVVEASHLHLPQRVAIKFLLGDGQGQSAAVERFLREAQVVVRLKGDHVVRMLDVGRLDDGSPYMVMEYLEGQDLGSLLKKHGTLGIPESVDLMLQVCEAVAEAHAAGIVHRDIKPANIFLTEQLDGSLRAKVLDFGISKDLGAAADPEGKMTLTGTAEMIGSPLYMSPEQMKSSRRVDRRTDMWSLGALAYRMLTGQPPFPAETITELVLAVTSGDPPRPPRELRPDMDPGLEEAILRCLVKDPSARFQNVAELSEALAPFGPPGSATAAKRVARVLGAAEKAKPSLTSSSDKFPKAVVTQEAGISGSGKTVTADGNKPRSPLPSDSSGSAAHAISASAARRGDEDASPHGEPRRRPLRRLWGPLAVAMGLLLAGVLATVLTRRQPEAAVAPPSQERSAPGPSAPPPEAPTLSIEPAPPPSISAQGPASDPSATPAGSAATTARVPATTAPVTERRPPVKATAQPGPTPPKTTTTPPAPPTSPPVLVDPQLK